MVLLSLAATRAATQTAGWDAPVNVSHTAGSSYSPRLALGSGQTLHMVWTDWVDTGVHWPYLYYANKPSGGSWSSPMPFPGSPKGGPPAAVTGGDGALHIVWQKEDGRTIAYIRRAADGVWSSIQTVASVSSPDELYTPDIAIGPDGTLHTAWRRRIAYNNSDIYYASRSPGGGWGAATLLYDGGDTTSTPVIAVDDLGAVYVFVSDTGGGSLLTRKAPGGGWSTPYPSREMVFSVDQLTSDTLGRVHMAWPDSEDGNQPYALFYAAKEPGEEYFGMPVTVTEACEMVVAVAADSAGMAHLAWEYNGALWYAFQLPGGGWSVPSLAASANPEVGGLSLAVDSAGRRHLAWSLGPDQDVWHTSISAEPPVSATITSNGGMLTSSGKRTQLTFPAGSVVTDTIVLHAAVTGQAFGGLTAVEFFDLSAHRSSDSAPVTSFPVDYTLTYTYTSTGAAIESTLELYSWDGSAWIKQNFLLDTALNRLTASLNHMTMFAIMGESYHTALPLIRR